MDHNVLRCKKFTKQREMLYKRQEKKEIVFFNKRDNIISDKEHKHI